MKAVLFAFVFLFTFPAQAAQKIAPYTAIVVAVHDGDSITIQAPGHKHEKIRLHGADCPELRIAGKWPQQPGADEARNATASLILGHTVIVNPVGISYRRTVADVSIAGMDVSRELLREGWGWAAPGYADAEDRALQNEARAAGRGLWAHPAIAPWLWRHRGR